MNFAYLERVKADFSMDGLIQLTFKKRSLHLNFLDCHTNVSIVEWNMDSTKHLNIWRYLKLSLFLLFSLFLLLQRNGHQVFFCFIGSCLFFSDLLVRSIQLDSFLHLLKRMDLLFGKVTPSSGFFSFYIFVPLFSVFFFPVSFFHI